VGLFELVDQFCNDLKNLQNMVPDLSDPVLRATLAKGMEHNYYREPMINSGIDISINLDRESGCYGMNS